MSIDTKLPGVGPFAAAGIDRRTLLALALSTALLMMLGCNPMSPSNHPGAPPAANEIIQQPEATSTPGAEQASEGPRKYGVPALLDRAKN